MLLPGFLQRVLLIGSQPFDGRDLARQITTIEGLGANEEHPLQKAWQEHKVPQCGYCQGGQILSAVSLLRAKPHPTDEELDAMMAGNICRCGTYPRVGPTSTNIASHHGIQFFVGRMRFGTQQGNG